MTATYPGASPEIVAEEVATPLEQAISGVSGVTKVRAVSTNGLASLTVEWDYGLDNDEVTSDIRSAGDGIPDLPDGVEYDVLAGSTDDIPVLVLGVASDAPLDELAKQVDDDRGARPCPASTGVRQVQVAGQDTTELVVTLRAGRAAQVRPHRGRGHPGGPVPGHRWCPAGNSYDGDTELAIQVGKTPTTAKQVAAWPIPAPDGPVKLGNLADVAVRSVEATTIARSDGRPALSLSILKESRRRRGRDLARHHAICCRDLTRSLGQNASVLIVFDQAPSIEQSIHDLADRGRARPELRRPDHPGLPALGALDDHHRDLDPAVAADRHDRAAGRRTTR